jgi:two-component sensor histidine kinase/PAS domain-containing protein
MNILFFLYNLSLLIALSSLSHFIHPGVVKLGLLPYLQGLLFGLVAMVGMLYPFSLYPGVFFDGRTVIILLSGLFFGSKAAFITVLLTLGFRVIQGGDGMVPGVVVILFTGMAAVGWRRFSMRDFHEVSLLSLFILGLITHLIMVLGIFLLPFTVTWNDVSTVALPVLSLFPLATVVSGAIIRNALHRDHLLQSLQDTTQLLEEAQQLGKVGGWIYDHRVEKLTVSEFGYQILGLTNLSNRLRYRDFLGTIHPDDQQKANRFFYKTLESNEPAGQIYEITHRMDPVKTGAERWVKLRWYHQKDLQGKVFITRGMSQDITEQVLREEQLKTFTQEKEILLREVLHRTRNNMQIILGLLNLRAHSVEDSKIADVLNQTSHRVLTMSYIQQQIYDVIHVSGINGSEFLEDLLQLLRQTYPSQVVLSSEADTDSVIPIETAVPLGMVIHEMVSNVLLHGDPEQNNPSTPALIKLSSQQSNLVLTVKNNHNRNQSTPHFLKGLGLTLTEMIVQDQIGGSMGLQLEQGIEWKIVIPVLIEENDTHPGGSERLGPYQ